MNVFVAGVQNSQEITHERKLVGCEGEARTFVHTMQDLGERLGPLLLQLPPDFTVKNREALNSFLGALPEGLLYSVEVRHQSWLDSDLPGLLQEHGAALTLVDYPKMPRIERATAGFVCIRWLGNRREFPSGHTGPRKNRSEDLRWWSGLVDCFLAEDRTVFAYANNHYQNHSPSTIEQFLEMRRG